MATATRHYEIVLSIKVKAKDADDARIQGMKLARGLTEKLGPTECQCVWRVREDEVQQR